ncbi:ABC transporter permease [Litorisediminicola beolgyonensis]|uniref:ABC transporter permease n=1 Tax=Litorisediminicola beolgyonensis TaxID=1173614 RepID=A0ABW3ZMG6_9RHOB
MSDSPQIHVETGADGARAVLTGRLTLARLPALQAALAGLEGQAPLRLDLGGIDRLDTAGAWALLRLKERMDGEGAALEFTGADPQTQALLDTVAAAMPHPDTEPAPPRTLQDRVASVGRAMVSAGHFATELSSMLGLVIARFARTLRNPGQFRFTALVHHAEAVGWQAVPIVALMAFLIGVVLAFQGATQLRQFGAEVFVVDLIAISILRELGILLTSIIVAGRTASAFTAAIGSMKMREEIDAMRTLGLDPGLMLFLPRVLALVLTLPILGLVANLSGLIGGGLMSWLELGISPQMFLTRLAEGEHLEQVLIGLSKAPVFAVIIGVVGCHAGMQVKGNAESLGRRTSASVVTAIFAVIVADALFSIFYSELGL